MRVLNLLAGSAENRPDLFIIIREKERDLNKSIEVNKFVKSIDLCKELSNLECIQGNETKCRRYSLLRGKISDLAALNIFYSCLKSDEDILA